MCYIYCAECKVCNKPIEMHLGDYDTDENEIEVFCSEHIPESNIVVWSDNKGMSTHGEWEIKEFSTLYGVRALTDNARKNKDKNHPNISRCEISEERL